MWAGLKEHAIEVHYPKDCGGGYTGALKANEVLLVKVNGDEKVAHIRTFEKVYRSIDRCDDSPDANVTIAVPLTDCVRYALIEDSYYDWVVLAPDWVAEIILELMEVNEDGLILNDGKPLEVGSYIVESAMDYRILSADTFEEAYFYGF